MTATLPMAATGRRWAVAALVALGAGLIAAPAIFRMFDRAPKGATMIGSFKPYMSPARLDAYRRDIAQSRCRCSARVRSNSSSVRSSSTHCLLIE